MKSLSLSLRSCACVLCSCPPPPPSRWCLCRDWACRGGTCAPPSPLTVTSPRRRSGGRARGEGHKSEGEDHRQIGVMQLLTWRGVCGGGGAWGKKSTPSRRARVPVILHRCAARLDLPLFPFLGLSLQKVRVLGALLFQLGPRLCGSFAAPPAPRRRVRPTPRPLAGERPLRRKPDRRSRPLCSHGSFRLRPATPALQRRAPF